MKQKIFTKKIAIFMHCWNGKINSLLFPGLKLDTKQGVKLILTS